ncbi:hypothetical protein CHS0354_034016 [Potamilus streckersoni]|uniref:G-protein coupled receptors family 1 profile domain-containing protein n=1 Tax=Potamilus streckersoni TaxID=2493646 RepID=A0AAE0RMW4_9BIVA|nr:hypothetical protein CHS0354_034016 [Potamilus streckersoni]
MNLTDKQTFENSTSNDTVHVSSNTTCLYDGCMSQDEYIDLIRDYIFPKPEEWVIVALYAVTFLAGIFGNALVCFVVWKNKNMRTVTNIFILNLSVGDLSVIVICLPSTLTVDVTQTWFFGLALCKTNLFLQLVSVSVSVLTLSAISVERWYAICYPLSFKSTIKRARIIIILIWIISIGIGIPELVVDEVFPFKPFTVYLTSCRPGWESFRQSTYWIVIVLALYVVPMCLMAFTYTHIARVLWSNEIPGTVERSHDCGSEMRTEIKGNFEQIESRKKAAKMLIAVVVVFGVCYLPVHILNLLRYTDMLKTMTDMTDIITIFSVIAHYFPFLNSSINPVIYNFMSEKFRREFKLALKMCTMYGKKARIRNRSEFYRMTHSSGRYSTRFNSHYNGNTHSEHVTISRVKTC